jgi:hypothetical protein
MRTMRMAKKTWNPALLLLALLILLVGCVAGSPTATPALTPTLAPSATPVAPTPTSAASPGPTSSPGPTATHGPTTTSAPSPTPDDPILPAWVMDCIGIGSEYSSFVYLNGNDASGGLGETPVHDVRLSDGRHVSFEYGGDARNPIIVRYQIDGSPAKTPVPDKKPVSDFQISKGGFALGLEADLHAEDLLTAFGTPLDDVTVDTYDDGLDYAVEQNHRVFARTVRYPGLEVILFQSPTATDKSIWRVVRLTITSSDYPTPRGLTTGLSVRSVLDLFGTGTFSIFSNGYAHGPQGLLAISIWRMNGDVLNKFIIVEMQDGKASRITLLVQHP